jgi:hypothetical protein
MIGRITILYMFYGDEYTNYGLNSKSYMFSVRCVRD